ncbi:polysaccharide deacetylase [Mucilaginibacter rubeus]|uniref:Polysaccharide deacetylase n=1 Tax=Mucilaginibacter rubeus TaxID=2027860 RepID=A0AAE6JMC6_9SPHI|nr:polysaccharide deacetylase [Mucilaginibacter rubeus]QEM20777.1 polysaccharide deacetylase [Mucilaginibacter gossypii]QTE46975.1 polysaccharide deacetylase [Mucilaginibacter rubeus]QTE53578.1 polysaccharide deacetylase [Mucilaginibacter rubeus]QTE60380.1 polysaccharide deacetylase [Mucilaginibacter rubeus]
MSLPLFILALLCTGTFAQTVYRKIENYKVYYGWARNYPQDWMILRCFDNEGRNYLLMVNPQTLETKINESSFYQIKPMTVGQAREFFKSTPYQKALSKAEKQSVNIQDAGIESGIPKQTGISLTADLCPSHRPLDKRIFTDIFTEFKKVERPVPIALSITGIWMRQHPQDLAWLKQMQANREIYITWINHSFNHRVSLKAPLKENFLLEPGTDISYEVLETEQAMLRNGLLPSVFFRFPGLVSDQQLVYRITGFGLIPVGTDAWLAKGQQPQNGSIVLIHGNGNEPVGVNDFIKLLQSKTRSIAGKQWLLYDLRESVDEEFSEAP